MDVTYYVAASLDGFIADSDGGVGWLEDAGIPIEQSGCAEFSDTVDGLVVGRKTYDQVCGFGAWPYGDKPTWVCSTQSVVPVPGCNMQRPAPPDEVVARARDAGLKHLWVLGGGVLAGSMLREGLLTRISVATMPIVLGKGIGLFGGLDRNVLLVLERSHEFAAGFVQHEYRPA